MKKTLTLLSIFTLISFLSKYSYGKGEVICLLVSGVEVRGGRIVQYLPYKSDSTFLASLELVCYQAGTHDSLALYSLFFAEKTFKQGYHSLSLDLQQADSIRFLDRSFLDAVKKLGRMPPGVYHIRLSALSAAGVGLEKQLLLNVDSSLAVGSGLRKRLNRTLSELRPAKQGGFQKEGATSPALGKIGKGLKKRGITTRSETGNGKTYAALYYKQWFLGRYELSATDLRQRIEREGDALKNAPASFVNDELEHFGGVNNQVRALFQSKEEKSLSGIVDITSAFGNGQYPNSQQEDNYLELRGELQTEVLSIPVSVEGFYTTQDRGRQAKAGYLRFHYDITRQKQKLGDLVSGYKSRYSEAASKGQDLDRLYQSYLDNLKAEQQKLSSSFKDYGIAPETLKELNASALAKELSSQIDTSGLAKGDSLHQGSLDDYQNALKKKDSLQKDLEDRYQRLLDNQKKIDRYTALLQQYKEQLILDSGLAFGKLRQLEKMDEASCKDMAKAASDLLPLGKAGKLLYGLTNLDIGILNQYESRYTAAGQTLKGGSLGYDFGLFKTSVTVGNTEYISRDGEPDRYSSTAVHTEFKPLYKQKLGVIYYTYSASRQLAQDDFFKEATSVPSFQTPVHIVSLTHEGGIGKNLTLNNEVAMSYQKKAANTKQLGLDNSAITTALEYNLTWLPVSFKGEWEHVGKDFQNSALPYIRSATERYTFAGKADVFRSFVSVGLQYNFLKQETFSSTGYNTRWGFDLKTSFKRYPNLLVSYKPFSTFRSYNDTFSVPQRPLSGEVWIIKGSYQIKRTSVSHRFTLMFNQNSTSTVDTQQYSSKTLQLGYIYFSKTNAINLNIGWMQLPQTGRTIGTADEYTPSGSGFVNASVSRMVAKELNVLLGQDLGFSALGLQRTATTIGVSYSLKKLPLQLRAQARYSHIKAEDSGEQVDLWQGQTGITWRFHAKMKSKNDL